MLGMKAFGARPAPKNYADGGAVKRRKASGPVRGPGTGISDEVPDEVPEGTYIMPADSTQAIGEQELAGLGAEQIPVNLSNGEFKLPPEQVHAVGVQALDQMRDATHTPAAQQGAGLGMKPELFFADGGRVANPLAGVGEYWSQSNADFEATNPSLLRRAGRAINPVTGFGSALGAMHDGASKGSVPEMAAAAFQAVPVFGATRAVAPTLKAAAHYAPSLGKTAATAAGSTGAGVAIDEAQAQNFADGGVVDDEEKRRQTALQPSPSSPSSTYPGNRFPAYDGRSTQPQTPAAPVQGFDPQARINEQVANAERQRAEGRAAAQRTERYDAIPQAQRQAAHEQWQESRQPWYMPTPRGDVTQQAAERRFEDTLAGRAEPVARQQGVAPSAPQGAAPQTQSLANAEEMQRRTGKGGELPAPQPEPVQVMPGVYRHGRGQYSDSAKGMGFAEGFTGRPSAQNMAAASNLAAQQQRESMGRVLAQQAQQAQAQQGVMQPRGFNAPQPKHSGNDWETRNHLRSLRMAAERAMENAPRKRFAAQHPAVIAYQQAQQADMQARGGQLDADLKTQEVNAAMQREQMQQQGASQRDAARLGLDQQRLALDERKSASEIRSADRQEKLYQRYEAAAEKGDAKGMAAVARQIRELKGSAQEAPWNFQVTPATKNVDGSTSEGSLLRYNPQTGAYEVLPLSGGRSSTGLPTPQSKAEYDALPKGAQYIKDGKTLIKG